MQKGKKWSCAGAYNLSYICINIPKFSVIFFFFMNCCFVFPTVMGKNSKVIKFCTFIVFVGFYLIWKTELLTQDLLMLLLGSGWCIVRYRRRREFVESKLKNFVSWFCKYIHMPTIDDVNNLEYFQKNFPGIE